MTRTVVLSGLSLWAGTTLLLSRLRWFSRRPLADRLRPYVPGDMHDRPRAGVMSVESFRDVIGPLSRHVGERVARLFGVSEELAVRLERVHSPLDVTTFRVRQVGWSIGGLAGGATIAAALRPPPGVMLLFLLGGPILTFLVLEQLLASTSAAWQRRIFLELPVVSEQLGMLLSAGYALGAALNRVASRGNGACARDLGRACGRMRQGLTEIEALREWATVARVDALDRLVAVLALNREAGDLGRLTSDEARSIRRDVQRQLVETMERRAQQVWVPVTVATLVPGVIFLAIPFIEAMRLFSGS
ncbi:MAG: type II secretion system F family protein [Actinomycetota bacterium]